MYDSKKYRRVLTSHVVLIRFCVLCGMNKCTDYLVVECEREIGQRAGIFDLVG